MGIVLRFSGSSNFAALAVKLYTWSWCSHVETVIDDKSHGKILYGALPTTGVGYRPIDSTEGDRVEEYEVKLSAVAKTLYIQKLLSQKDKPYDYSAIASMVLHQDRDWKAQNAWFCSELVSWALSEVGFPALRTEHLNRVTPANLLMSPLLKRIS